VSTSAGLVQVVPPFDELVTKVSMFVTGFALSWTPLRLSSKTRYTFPLASTAILPAELTRTWYPVSVWRPSSLIG
jgi:hypothetical protein